MIILVGGATRTVAEMPKEYVGHLLSPRSGNSLEKIVAGGRKWAADNDAFAAWDIDRFWRMICKIIHVDRSNLLWVAVPDVVGDAQGTINRWFEWFPQLDYLDLPLAFVGQDGLGDVRDQIPWQEIACLFIGGSTAWKLSAEAEEFAREAKLLGKHVHMGRVNSLKRMRHAMQIGCNSIDGRSFSAWSRRWQPWMVRHIRREKSQLMLF